MSSLRRALIIAFVVVTLMFLLGCSVTGDFHKRRQTRLPHPVQVTPANITPPSAFAWTAVGRQYYNPATFVKTPTGMQATFTSTCTNVCKDIRFGAQPKCMGWDYPNACRKTGTPQQLMSASPSCTETGWISVIGLDSCCCGPAPALQPAPSTRACGDSDGGNDYFVKGSTCVSDHCEEDSCAPDNLHLIELYCLRGQTISSELYACSHGCQNGACLKEAGPPVPPPTTPTVPPQQTISAGCATINKSNTIYKVTTDLSCDGGDILAFAEGVSGVVLDCQNHVLTLSGWKYPPNAAIRLPGGNNANTIKNCKITAQNVQNPHHGVVIIRSQGNNVKNNVFEKMYGAGILLINSQENTITKNTLSNVHSAISLYYSSNNNITENTLTWNLYGINIGTKSNNNLIKKNEGSFHSGEFIGLGLGGLGSETLPAGFDISISLANAPRENLIDSNNGFWNIDDGIVILNYANHNQIINNIGRGDIDAPLEFVGETNNNIIQNNLFANSGVGGIFFKTEGAVGNVIKFNILNSNSIPFRAPTLGPLAIDAPSIAAANTITNNTIGKTMLSSTPEPFGLFYFGGNVQEEFMVGPTSHTIKLKQIISPTSVILTLDYNDVLFEEKKPMVIDGIRIEVVEVVKLGELYLLGGVGSHSGVLFSLATA